MLASPGSPGALLEHIWMGTWALPLGGLKSEVHCPHDAQSLPVSRFLGQQTTVWGAPLLTGLPPPSQAGQGKGLKDGRPF